MATLFSCTRYHASVSSFVYHILRLYIHWHKLSLPEDYFLKYITSPKVQWTQMKRDFNFFYMAYLAVKEKHFYSPFISSLPTLGLLHLHLTSDLTYKRSFKIFPWDSNGRFVLKRTIQVRLSMYVLYLGWFEEEKVCARDNSHGGRKSGL